MPVGACALGDFKALIAERAIVTATEGAFPWAPTGETYSSSQRYIEGAGGLSRQGGSPDDVVCACFAPGGRLCPSCRTEHHPRVTRERWDIHAQDADHLSRKRPHPPEYDIPAYLSCARAPALVDTDPEQLEPSMAFRGEGGGAARRACPRDGATTAAMRWRAPFRHGTPKRAGHNGVPYYHEINISGGMD